MSEETPRYAIMGSAAENGLTEQEVCEVIAETPIDTFFQIAHRCGFSEDDEFPEGLRILAREFLEAWQAVRPKYNEFIILAVIHADERARKRADDAFDPSLPKETKL